VQVTDVDERKLYQIVGQRIRDLRLQRTPKLTQARLASLLEVERTSVTNIESGTQRPPLALLYRLSLELDAPLHEMLPSTEDVRILRPPSDRLADVPLPPKTASVINRLSLMRRKTKSRRRS
jgi:transcriptional regulator with XRE-family HTH domain